MTARPADVERLVRSIWEKDTPEMLAKLRPRLVREVRELEATCAALPTDDVEAHKAQAQLADARYYLEVFDGIVRRRGVTLPGEGKTT
jgi:hypothetical protein